MKRTVRKDLVGFFVDWVIILRRQVLSKRNLPFDADYAPFFRGRLTKCLSLDDVLLRMLISHLFLEL